MEPSLDTFENAKQSLSRLSKEINSEINTTSNTLSKLQEDIFEINKNIIQNDRENKEIFIKNNKELNKLTEITYALYSDLKVK